MLAFYTENSAIINGLIVLYGLVLFLCNRNFLAVKKQAKSTLSKISKKDLAKVTWGDVLIPTEKIQLIANIKSWIPRKASATNLERLFPIKSLIEEYQNEHKHPKGSPVQIINPLIYEKIKQSFSECRLPPPQAEAYRPPQKLIDRAYSTTTIPTSRRQDPFPG